MNKINFDELDMLLGSDQSLDPAAMIKPISMGYDKNRNSNSLLEDLPDELVKKIKNPRARKSRQTKNIQDQMESISQALVGLNKRLLSIGDGPVKTPANDMSVLDKQDAVGNMIIPTHKQANDLTKQVNAGDVYRELERINGSMVLFS